jgi:uncharacterized protein
MHAHAPWYVAGPLLGLVIVAMMWVTAERLGALGGYVGLVDGARSGTFGWRVVFLGGVVLGALVYALVAGGPHATFEYELLGVSAPAGRVAVLATAGVLMGYGARLAGGCTSGHGMCGSALASPASWAATATFMATAVVGEHVLSWAVSS